MGRRERDGQREREGEGRGLRAANTAVDRSWASGQKGEGVSAYAKRHYINEMAPKENVVFFPLAYT